MKILNLGCGTKTSDAEGVVNIDWSIYLKLKNSSLLRMIAPLFIRGGRAERFKALPDNILVHDLSKGIPFESDSIDVVYHSHTLEHLDRDVGRKFMLEVKRVLKSGGIHRIVVPDFEHACQAYISHITACDANPEESENHEDYIAGLIEQSVRRESYGTSTQKPLRKAIENLVLGDARRRGETHQWMYDRISLKNTLMNLGYSEVHVQNYNSSLISDWDLYGLDLNEDGGQYKPHSLYAEAVK